MRAFSRIFGSIIALSLATGFCDQAMAQSFGRASAVTNNAARRALGDVNRYSARQNVLRRTSPYLRLARNPTAFQARSALDRSNNRFSTPQQTQQLQTLSTQVRNLSSGGPGRGQSSTGFTGHPTRFNTTSHYFQTIRQGF